MKKIRTSCREREVIVGLKEDGKGSGNASWSVPAVVNLDRELESCIGVFPGVEKNQSVLWRNEAGFHLLE